MLVYAQLFLTNVTDTKTTFGTVKRSVSQLSYYRMCVLTLPPPSIGKGGIRNPQNFLGGIWWC